ncbi:MAG TPA: DNA methyltransferase [Patescibacteria group bacterium]|nr:DNA methyltransferase [Patescibacteria group bacterium]
MVLSWNEIKDRALNFSKEWAGTSNEEADAKPFLVEFFNVFGISSKRVSTFEHRVKKLDEKDGYIDLLWKGTILIEMKSRGKNLDRAFQQAKDYLHGLKQYELPKYILISDFETFRLYDLEEEKTIEFTLSELVHNVHHFGYILGYQKKVYKEQDPANIKAAELMGRLHDRLKEIGYTGHPLEVYLVRILFCLFAEDTTIFNKQQFQEFLEQRTSEDGSDLASRLHELFQVLNTPKESRFKNLDEQLADFPYVNGKLFEEILPTASFDTKMRQALLDCCYIDWSKISPAIFGSMFQSVMNPVERRNLGAHYTSETNILKLIKPLFLDELWKEFESIRDNKNKLPQFHRKLSTLKFLDPACGCGNFLVITYRELRLLELEILRALNKSGQRVFDVAGIIRLDVDMMYGIEYEEFPARIAEVAMWLIDHQMNMLISNEFGQYFVRLPLKKSAKIVHGNALKTDWESVVPKSELSFILGNPPFIGKSNQSPEQKVDMDLIFKGMSGVGVLDYVTAWYLKAAQYIQDTKIKVAFVSTNSISQGEQVGILWNLLFKKYHIKIHFAHRTFNWRNEARGNAAVHVVIIGFANFDIPFKRLFDYENINGEAHEISVKNINPYLLEGKDLVLLARTNPINNVPKMIYGSKPVDDGNFFFTNNEKEEFVLQEPLAEKYIKPILSSQEFLNGKKRWCLWLNKVNPSELNKMSLVLKRLENIRKFRENSTKASVKKQAATPTLFSEIRQPKDNYIIIPRHSSETRKYIPFGFFDSDTIVSDSCIALPNATLFHFGILTSALHNAWIKYTCGRIKSDYRYSNILVYNNFPWPENPTEKHIKATEEKAQKVLDTRAMFPESSLADLYDPLTMPPALVRAHNELDKAVDLAYRPQPFTSEANRMEFLFELYERYTANLFTKEKPKKGKKVME